MANGASKKMKIRIIALLLRNGADFGLGSL